MLWNNSELYTSLLMIELQEGVSFKDSPISLNLGMTSMDSPALSNPEVNAFLADFQKFGIRAWFEVDSPEGVFLEKPGIFIAVGDQVTRADALEAISLHLPRPYTPHLPDFHILGFFPSRPGCPVREISRDGKGYEEGKLTVQEGVSNPPDWVPLMVREAKEYCKCFYNHYKTSVDGTNRKVYVIADEVY